MTNRRDLLRWACAAAVSGLVAVAPPRATAARATKLLLVHGRSQQGLNPEALKTEWMATLARGATALGLTIPSAIEVAFPYYGDTLDRFTRQFGIPLTSDMQARGTPQDDEFLVFQAEFAEAVRQRAG